MPKDLISVEQGGVAVINASTPKNVKGLYTDGVESCAILFLANSNNRSIAMIHVDNYTTEESLKVFVGDFGVTDFKIFANLDLFIGGHQGIYDLEENLNKITRVMGKEKITDENAGESLPQGTILIEFEPETLRLGFDFTKAKGELLERSLDLVALKKLRHDIRYLKRIFLGDQPLELEYDGKWVKKFIDIDDNLRGDVLRLHDLTYPEQLRWIGDNSEKYPQLKAYKSENPLQTERNYRSILNCVGDYLKSARDFQLTSYTIPDINEAKKKLLEEISQPLGENSEIKFNRKSDWSLSCEIKLPSDLLKKDVRDVLRVDRRRVREFSQGQLEFLQDVGGITIEKDSQQGKTLVTFSANLFKYVELAADDKKWQEYCKTGEFPKEEKEEKLDTPSSSPEASGKAEKVEKVARAK